MYSLSGVEYHKDPCLDHFCFEFMLVTWHETCCPSANYCINIIIYSIWHADKNLNDIENVLNHYPRL